MQAAIVGATGILGRWLVPMLVGMGWRVCALTPSPEKARKLFGATVEASACDLLDPLAAEQLPGLLAGCDAVANIATSLPRDLSVPGAFERNNRLRTEGVERLLLTAAKAGVAQYVQQSTVFDYPDCGEDWIREEVPLAPSTGVVAAMERMVQASGLQWCILRGGRFVGKDTYQELTVAALRERRELVPCDGRNFVSLIHVADMASACAAALAHATTGAVLNVVAEPLRNGEYLDGLAARAGAPPPRRDANARCPKSQRCCNVAAQSALDWAPRHSIYAYNE